MRSTEKYSRRSFLKASAIGAGMLPLLEPELAQSACLAAGRKRLITLAWGNGVQDWVRGTGTDFTMPAFMKGLEPHRSDLLLPNMLWNKAWEDGYPKDIPNAAHDSPLGMLVGRRCQGRFVATGPSVDYFVGNELKKRGNLPWSVINLGVMRRAPYWTCLGPGAIATPDDDPYHAFDQIFGGARTGTTQNLDQARLLRKSVLDYVRQDIERFARNLGQDDKLRIDAHLTSIRDIEGRLDAGALAADCTVPVLGPKFDIQSSDNYERVVRAQIDIGVAALAAGLSQVLTIQVSNGSASHVILSWLGYGKTGVDPGFGGGDMNAHHGVAHAGGEKKDAVDGWFFDQAGYLIDKLKSIKEGSVSIFDQSVVLIPNNMDNGTRHHIMGLRWVLAGSAGGYFKPGRALPTQNDYTTTVLVSLIKAMDVDPKNFADTAYQGELPGLRG